MNDSSIATSAVTVHAAMLERIDWNARLRASLARGRQTSDDGVIEELAQHARAMFEAARADGCSSEESERRVDVQIELWRAEGDSLRHRTPRVPAIEPPPPDASAAWSGIAQDTRYAVRLVRRQPRYALLVVLMMALGIGATTTLFSVAYGVLMKPLPWPNAERVVLVKETRGGHEPRFGALTNAAYLAWQEDAKTIEGLGGWSRRLVTLSGAGDPERIAITVATPSLFPVLGARPLLGSFFQADDRNPHVAVLSEALWRQRFGGDPGVLGRVVHFDAEPYTVIGVLLAAFATLAVVIAAVGLFGVLSYSVAQRSRGLAVRSALGAGRADIIGLVLRDGLVVTVAGIGVGLVASIVLTQSISALLYGVTTRDAVTYAAVPLLVLVVASLACIAPALGAARLDPLSVLRGGRR